MTKLRTDSVCVHGDNHQDEPGSPVVPPIIQSTTFTLPINLKDGPQADNQLLYTRVRNPNFEEVEEVVRRLEGANGGCLFGSGMAAVAATVNALTRHGDLIVVMSDVYGTTRHLFDQLSERGERRIAYLDLTNDEALYRNLPRLNPRLVWVESVSNPMLKIVNLHQLAQMRKSRGFAVAVDNTFATPLGCRPLDIGCDVVVHSATKYLAGHSDVIAGIALADHPATLAAIETERRHRGGISDPFAAWLLRRGMQTLAIRMQAHERNATALAAALEVDLRVARVFYPGLVSHPQYGTARCQMDNSGGMLTVCLATDRTGVFRFLSALKLARVAVSLGGVETLVNHPCSMTHGHLDPDTLLRLGIDERVLRISVGIEDARDIIDDFKQALGAI